MRIGEEANFNVEITPQAPIGVVIGDNAKMDVVKAVNYIESGKKEIEKAVEDGKADFDDHAADKTQDFDDNAVNKTNAFNQNAVNKTQAFDDNAAIKQAAVDASAAEAKQWAIGDPTEPTGNSAKYWANQASSELSGLTSRVTTIEGKIPAEASETNKLTDKDYVDTALALKANASNTVTTNTVQTISETKTFSKEIFATLASYSAINGASNASPYKKIGECILTGTYQIVIVPFMYSRTHPTTSSVSYLGKIVLRTEGTAGTLSQNTSGVIISEVPDFIDTGDIGLYVVYKDNTPESNQVTCQIWVYVKNTYQGVNIMPLRQGTGGGNYSTTNITWGNNLVEASELPSDYTSIIQKKAVIYNVTQSSTDNSRRVATTAYVKNNLVNYVTTNTSQSITADKIIQKSNPQIVYKNTDMTRGTTPASNINHSIVRWADYSNTVMGYIRTFYSTDGYWGMGFQLTEGSTYPEMLISMNSSGTVKTSAPTPTDDNTTSTQIDTVGARNTKLGSMFQVVASLPATPDADTFYFIQE